MVFGMLNSSIFSIQFFVTIIIAYLVGCINSSILVGKILNVKQDIRDMGSGNAGFTNTLRTVGKKAAVLTFLGDFTKGVLAVWIGIKICCSMSNTCDLMAIKLFSYSAALACVKGHIYPCFFNFRGGKGILTAWACSLLIDWRVFLVLITVFLLVLVFSKIVSLSSICAAVAYPVATFLINHFCFTGYLETLISTSFTFVIGLIVIYKHRSNIKRILNGEEKRISVSKV